MLSVESVSIRVWMCVCLFTCLSVCWTTVLLLSPSLVRPLVEFIFIVVNETLSVCKIKGSLQRHTAVLFQQNILKGFQRCWEGM